MKRTKKATLAIAALLLSGHAMAAQETQPPMYFLANGAYVELEANHRADVNMWGGSVGLGYDFTPHIALEGRLGLTGEDEINGVDVNIDYFVSAFLRLGMPVGVIKPYALLGYTHAQVSVRGNGVDVEEDDEDFSYGAGFEVQGWANTNMTLEFIRYRNDDPSVDAWQIGFTHHF